MQLEHWTFVVELPGLVVSVIGPGLNDELTPVTEKTDQPCY